jgi:hypothetical protein
VQVIYAGKAHPRDEAGQDLIRQLVTLSRREPFLRRLVFLEIYDVGVARMLVQGCPARFDHLGAGVTKRWYCVLRAACCVPTQHAIRAVSLPRPARSRSPRPR